MKRRSLRLIVLSLLIGASYNVQGQSSTTKIYRGSIGDKHVEMRLNIAGSKVSGSYFYDQFKQDITLEGNYDAKGQLLLTEGTGKQKSGKFLCKAQPETPDTDVECEWSRMNGTGQMLVSLSEQSVRFKSDLKLVPKVINDRKTSVFVSYPQLSGGPNQAVIDAFNQLVSARVKSAIEQFDPITKENTSFTTNYNVMWATDDLVSIEMQEYSFAGGAHPNTRVWTINYSLKKAKELKIEDVLNADSDYKSAIAEFAARDISRRAAAYEEDEARRSQKPVEKRVEPFMTPDGLPEMDTWAVSEKGLAVYFDFPHVMAVFDKTIVPYSAVSRFLRPDGPIPLVK